MMNKIDLSADNKMWIISNLVDDPGRIQAVEDSRGQAKCLKAKRMESLSDLESDIGEVEGMLKTLIKSLENKYSNPYILQS